MDKFQLVLIVAMPNCVGCKGISIGKTGMGKGLVGKEEQGRVKI